MSGGKAIVEVMKTMPEHFEKIQVEDEQVKKIKELYEDKSINKLVEKGGGHCPKFILDVHAVFNDEALTDEQKVSKANLLLLTYDKLTDDYLHNANQKETTINTNLTIYDNPNDERVPLRATEALINNELFSDEMKNKLKLKYLKESNDDNPQSEYGHFSRILNTVVIKHVRSNNYENLFHEIGHAFDWESNNNLKVIDRILFLKEIDELFDHNKYSKDKNISKYASNVLTAESYKKYYDEIKDENGKKQFLWEQSLVEYWAEHFSAYLINTHKKVKNYPKIINTRKEDIFIDKWITKINPKFNLGNFSNKLNYLEFKDSEDFEDEVNDKSIRQSKLEDDVIVNEIAVKFYERLAKEKVPEETVIKQWIDTKILNKLVDKYGNSLPKHVLEINNILMDQDVDDDTKILKTKLFIKMKDLENENLSNQSHNKELVMENFENAYTELMVPRKTTFMKLAGNNRHDETIFEEDRRRSSFIQNKSRLKVDKIKKVLTHLLPDDFIKNKGFINFKDQSDAEKYKGELLPIVESYLYQSFPYSFGMRAIEANIDNLKCFEKTKLIIQAFNQEQELDLKRDQEFYLKYFLKPSNSTYQDLKNIYLDNNGSHNFFDNLSMFIKPDKSLRESGFSIFKLLIESNPKLSVAEIIKISNEIREFNKKEQE